MNDPIEHLRQAGAFDTSPVPPGSRYHGVPVARLEQPGREPIAYLRRRFIPRPERYVEVERHITQQGDRIDLIAAQYLGDPGLYWQIADANAAMSPDELTEEPGRPISITLPDATGGALDG